MVHPRKKEKALKKQLENESLKNFKLMWGYANWQWRMIIILGLLTLSGLAFWFGSWIVGLFGG